MEFAAFVVLSILAVASALASGETAEGLAPLDTGGMVDTLAELEERTYALWVADNVLTRVRMDPTWRAPGRYAGREVIEIVDDLVESGQSILIMGRPGIGKLPERLNPARRFLAEGGQHLRHDFRAGVAGELLQEREVASLQAPGAQRVASWVEQAKALSRILCWIACVDGLLEYGEDYTGLGFVGKLQTAYEVGSGFGVEVGFGVGVGVAVAGA